MIKGDAHYHLWASAHTCAQVGISTHMWYACHVYARKEIDESLFSEPPNVGLHDLLKQLFTFSLRVASPSLTLEMK